MADKSQLESLAEAIAKLERSLDEAERDPTVCRRTIIMLRSKVNRLKSDAAATVAALRAFGDVFYSRPKE